MKKATRTLNPLHFEDLEPHRFEDLVRGLVYDFKKWKKIDAIGRSGDDEGFDIRAWEAEGEIATSDTLDVPEMDEKIWLIQCKRELHIGPSKIKTYVKGILDERKEALAGIIFAASCTFSKAAKDAYYETCREYGVAECYLWGKGELEDMLYQPKNDHLLFAFFGFSLKIRERSLKTNINSILTIKRKAQKVLEDSQHILLRDAEDEHYPDDRRIVDFQTHPSWKVCEFLGYCYKGVEVVAHKHFAYLADDKIHWDYIPEFDLSRSYNDPWPVESDREKQAAAHHFWLAIPEKNRAWWTGIGMIAYEDILAIDEIGDEYAEFPHIYIAHVCKEWGFFKYRKSKVANLGFGIGKLSIEPRESTRIKFFPNSFPDILPAKDVHFMDD